MRSEMRIRSSSWPGFVPAIHVFLAEVQLKTWMPGTSPGMTSFAVDAEAKELERFQAKWKPVRVKKTRQIENLEPRFDSIETEKALGGRFPGWVIFDRIRWLL